MKNYIPLLMLICFATFSNAQNDFESQWDKVRKLENEGLTKSASEVVEVIYQKAVKENLPEQRIKALLYKSKYILMLEEDAQLTIVNRFKTEIENSNGVTKAILENMLATMYWQYFQQSRYQFYNRTHTSEKLSDDFRTWDLKRIFGEIHTYFQRSLQNKEVLQHESLDTYNLILNEATNAKDFRPTWYDLLSHNALDFYKTDENSITQPAYKFAIDDERYISDWKTFVKSDLKAKDSLSLQRNALEIYQNLLKFHQGDITSKAFVDVDIERLVFVKQHATFPNSDELMLETLRSTANDIKTSEQSTLYEFEIASVYSAQGQIYDSRFGTDVSYAKNRWKLKAAIEQCESTIARFPKSIGAEKCEVLMAHIRQPSLQLQTETFIGVDSPSKVLATYQNLERLDFNIYKVSKLQLEQYNNKYRVNEKEDFFKNLEPIETFSHTLKSEGDYQSHSTEIVVPSLPNGLYLVKAATATTVFAADDVQVTDLALIENAENDSQNYQIINRHNGEPIQNAKVNLSYATNRNDNRITKSYTTDRFGKFEFKKDHGYYRNVEITVSSNNDTAYFGNHYINRSYSANSNKDTQYHTFLFTDRSIYRPGQVVYFKGIVTANKDGKTSVAAAREITAQLHNVNGEKVSELILKSNEFGSFHGEFIIPNSGLTGQYYINTISNVVGNGYTYFSVEDYKRPKFKPELRPITQTYKINDSITVNGTAMAFAGSNITDAEVVYRVKRNVRYPSWYYWRRPYYNSEPQEITFGTTKTNAKGEFEITFKALPDDSVSEDNLPVFSYEVTADVTDINGETRSTSTIVRVGYHAMTLNLTVAEPLNKDLKSTEITVTSQNLNGQSVPAKGQLKIYKLKAPKRVLRTRPWPAPDYQTLSEAEFKRLFPHEPYKNEHQLTNWDKGEQVFTTDFHTENDNSITIKGLKQWQSGQYIIVAESKDRFGQTVKDETFTTLYSANDKTVADNQLYVAQLDKTTYAVGAMAQLTLGSAANNITVTVEIEKDDKIILTQLVPLNNSKKTIKIPVTDGDLGGFVVHTSFAAFNEYVSRRFKVNVPYPKTDLEIETTTFRDKLQPGQDETWSFKIKGPKGDKVSAELLASMYDASLDEFLPHRWNFNPINHPVYYGRINKNARQSFGTTTFNLFNNFNISKGFPYQGRDQLNWFGFYFGTNYHHMNRRFGGVEVVADAMEEMEAVSVAGAPMKSIVVDDSLNELDMGGYDERKNGAGQNEAASNNQPTDKINPVDIQIRKNLNETAFFFPQLQTDEEGNVSFNFKAPEALTKWKLQLLAHTKTLESAVTQMESVTQKELMVIPNAPRFLREGDQISISTKIANLTEKELSGVAQLILTDAVTGTAIDTELSNANAASNFVVDAKGNAQVSWRLDIPKGIQAVQYKIIAKAGEFSDGEQNALPVLSNRMLVTETLPMWVRSNETRTFTLEKLKNTTSTTLSHHKLSLEITSNPAWYAVQALPYLMEYPYDCNEQTFSRYYANALARHIVHSNPKIEAVFNQWKSTDALLSNLEKNQELKSLLIQETPWLRDAESEMEQKKRIALLFDFNKMNTELQAALRKLKHNQYPSGAWPWFNGGRDNRFITQHIIAGFGHLKTLKVNPTEQNDESQMIQNALRYLDAEFVKAYKDIRKYNKDADLSKDHLSHTQLHYLYTRSFYPEIKPSKEVKTIMAYYKGQIQKYWLNRSLYAKGLMALTMHRMDETQTAGKIVKSLKQNSITSDELGMYWKANANSWYWYQAPIETQALMIETFSEIGTTFQEQSTNLEDIDNLKLWLLKHKQTNSWKTTKATSEAVYALLLQGSDWLSVTEQVEVTVGDEKVAPSALENVKVEAGTGYYKTSWTGSEISAKKAEVTLNKKGKGIAWGALYWQYFEDLDKITAAELPNGSQAHPLKLSKSLFLKSNTDKGEEITEITSDTALKVGDLIRVRIELRTDRTMEFVHLKDMRAAGLEPINVLSQYKWQDGLGYYESTKDAATNFFMDYLPKGVFVFEYDLRVNNAGNMSNGISTIQSMYAPEFSSHSKGVRIVVEQ